MSWTLVICIGVNWAGCGAWQRVDIPNRDDCFAAASAAKVDGVNSVAYCIPKPPATLQDLNK